MNKLSHWINDPAIIGQVCAVTVRHPETGEVLIGHDQVITPDWIEYLDGFGVDSVICK